jgi:hypothetical protein
LYSLGAVGGALCATKNEEEIEGYGKSHIRIKSTVTRIIDLVK